MATNKKTNSILTFAAAAVFALVFYVGITNAESGSYYYAAISGIHGEKISVKYRRLDGDLYYICDTANLSCLKSDENNFTVAKTPPQLTDKNHFFNRDRSKVFVSDSSGFGASEVIRNAVYAVSPENLITLERILPSKERVFRAMWSDNGNVLVLLTRDHFATGIDINNNKILYRRAFPDQTRASRLTLSPEGKYLAYYIPGYTTSGKRTFVLWNLENDIKHEMMSKINYWDLLSEDLKLFDFSPDGSFLVYLDDREGFATLYKITLDGSSPLDINGTRVIPDNFTVNDFEVTDKSTLYVTANPENPLVWSLFRRDLTNGRMDKMADSASYSDNMAMIGKNLLFFRSTSSGIHPFIHNVSDYTGEKTAEKTFSSFSGAPAVGNSAPVKDEKNVKFLNTDKVKGVMLLPPKYNKKKTYPVLVWLHGGPYRQTSAGFHAYWGYGGYDEMVEEIRAEGAIVLKLDYTGSYGYGRDFAEQIKNNVGTKDVEDVVNAVEFAKSYSKVSKVYLMGNSYGGYLSLRATVEKPNPPQQSDIAYDQMRRAGINARIVEYDEDHAILMRENLQDLCRKTIEMINLKKSKNACILD